MSAYDFPNVALRGSKQSDGYDYNFSREVEVAFGIVY